MGIWVVEKVFTKTSRTSVGRSGRASSTASKTLARATSTVSPQVKSSCSCAWSAVAVALMRRDPGMVASASSSGRTISRSICSGLEFGYGTVMKTAGKSTSGR